MRGKFCKRYKPEITAYALLAIPLLWWGVFFLYAFVRAFYFSFTDLRFSIDKISVFNADNYVRLFQDKTFYRALGNTGIWTVAMTAANNFVGLMTAYMLFRFGKGSRFFLALLFWPTLVSAVAGAQITKILFDPSDTGLVNVIIAKLGGSPLGWYNDPDLALPTLMIVPFLLGFSTQMLLYYVAFNSVPASYVEAAYLETDSRLAVLSKIYLPLIRNTVSVNLLLSVIGNLKVLGPMQLVSDGGKGGPLDSTMSVMLLLYNKGITGYEMGYACAIGVVTSVIIMVLGLLQQKLTGKAEDYE